MKNLTLRNIQEITKGKLYNGKDVLDREISAVVSDSRKVRDDCLFICIKGEHADGHDFAKQAMKDGALAFLSEKRFPNYKEPYILVDSVFEATQTIAEFYRRSLNVKVVGVTGSVGKTSTKEFIAAVLKRKFRVAKTKGNLNNQWGVPFTIFDIKDDDEIAVIEMGISDFGEMDQLARMARPNVVVITNIGQSHLEFFKTRDGILKAKTEIFNYLEPGDSVLLNGDDDKLVTITKAKSVRPEFFGFQKRCTVCAENIRDHGFDGTEFDVVVRDRGGKMSFHVKLQTPGVHMIRNALAAVHVALKFNVPILQIAAAFKDAKTIEGRNQIIDTGKLTIIDDAYNASPASMISSIDLLKKADGRKVAILGDMFELGDGSDKFHFQVGKYAGEAGIDLIVCVGENSGKTFLGAKLACDTQVEYYKSLDDAITRLPELLRVGDTVLVKASNGMHFSTIVEMLEQA